MRKAFVVVFAAFAIGAFSAPVPQASQAWVEMKIEKVKAEILSYLSTANTNGISDAQAIDNAVSIGMAEMQGIASLGMAITPAVSGDYPYYLIATASPSYTNSIPVDSMMTYAAIGTYTNALGATLVEIGATNTLSFSSYVLTCPTNSCVFYPAVGDGFAVVVKVER